MDETIARNCVTCGAVLIPRVYENAWRFARRNTCGRPCRVNMTIAEKFWRRVDKNGPVPSHRPELGPCWLWTAYRNGDGYGILSVGLKSAGTGRTVGAHRVAFFVAHGRWPEPQALHACDGGSIGCVRPEHLFEGTQKDNMADCSAKGRVAASRKTHCPKGHPYDEENTRLTRGGGRMCKTCGRDKAREAARAKARAKRAAMGVAEPAQ